LPAVSHEVGWQAAQHIKHRCAIAGQLPQYDVLAFSENFNLVGIQWKFLGQAHHLAVARLENAGKGHDALLQNGLVSSIYIRITCVHIMAT
jgi:hypothetical protein